MTVLLAEATVAVKTDTSSVGPDAEKGVKSQRGVFSRIGTVAGGIIAAQLVTKGVAAVKSIFTTGLGEAKDASALNAQLAAAITSTGNAAGVSVSYLNERASAIQAMSGQTDDSIAAAQSLLLRFQSINNNGPDKIFDRATLAAANMAARLGGDASSQATKLGIALESPEKAVAKLARSGVTFSEDQKKMIDALVETGDKAGAQKIILDQLDATYGGAAESAGKTLPGMLARIRRGYEDVTQVVTEAFMPVVLPVLGWLADRAETAGDRVKSVTDNISSFFGDIDIGSLVETIQQFSPLMLIIETIKPLLPQLADSFKQILPIIKDVATSFGSTLGTVLSEDVVPALTNVLEALVPLIPLLAESLGDALIKLMPAFSDLIVAVLPLLPPLTDLLLSIIPPFAALLTNVTIPALVWLVEVFAGAVTAATDLADYFAGDTSLSDLADRVNALGGPFGKFVKWIEGLMLAIWNNFIAPVIINFKKFQQVVADVVGNVLGFFGKITTTVGKVGEKIGTSIGGAATFIGSTFGNIVNFVKGGINNVISLVNKGIAALNKFKVTLPDALGGMTIGLSIPSIPMLARGSNNAPDTFIAGEKGPELITGAAGSTVRPYSATQDILAQGGGTTNHFAAGAFTIDLSKIKSLQDLIDLIDTLNQTIRTNPTGS